MSRKSEVALMVQGLGLAIEFIRRLVAKVTERGGYEEMIHFLATERGEETLNQIADLIVTAPWRVPRSLIERLAAEVSIEQYGPKPEDQHPEDFWGYVLENLLKVPVVSFVGESEIIPDEIKNQLLGHPLVQGSTIIHDGREYLLIGLDFISFGYTVKDASMFINGVVTIVDPRFVDLSR